MPPHHEPVSTDTTLLSLSLTRLSRHNLESSRREQRLMVEPRHRALSVGAQLYTSGGLSASPPQTSPLPLPAPEDAHPLYKDYKDLDRWLRSEQNRIEREHEPVRVPLSGAPQAAVESRDDETATILYRLRCKVEDAIAFEENREKRMAAGSRSHLAPSDATKQQVRESLRTYTIDSENSTMFNRFEAHANMDDSTATIRPGPGTPSPKASPSASPHIEREFFGSPEWARSPTFTSRSPDLGRSSVSTTRSSISITSDRRLSPSTGLGISTADTTPENALSHTLRSVLSSASLATIFLGDAALKWTPLCRKIKVERRWWERGGGKEQVMFEHEDCDIQWKHREDGGMSLRALHRSKKDGKVRVWTTQDFPPLGPSMPLTTTIDGETSIDFPKGSFGKLDKQWIDIKYIFASSEASTAFQTLLYTDNGRIPAELLFDRPIRTISSDKHRPECRARNLRLWRRSEMHLDSSEPVQVDVLVVSFYASCLEEKGHWVEEPHHAFEWLTGSVYNKTSDKLTLAFSKEPEKWRANKLFKRRKSSQASINGSAPTSPVTAVRKDSMEIPGITRTGSGGSVASSAASIRSSHSNFGRRPSSRIGKLNAFGYAKLDIEFQNSKDREAFLEVWRKYVKPLGTLS